MICASSVQLPRSKTQIGQGFAAFRDLLRYIHLSTIFLVEFWNDQLTEK
jgi:hypothetical protein